MKPLTYDGLLVGWLYCELNYKGHFYTNRKTFYLRKITIDLLSDQPQSLQFTISLNNTTEIYHTYIQVINKMTILPKLKKKVKLSDRIEFSFGDKILPVSFLVDMVKRGKTAQYSVWLRNELKNKVGEMKLQYFLDNVWMENERITFTRRNVLPNLMQQDNQLEKIVQKNKKTHRKSLTLINLIEDFEQEKTTISNNKTAANLLFLQGKKQKSMHFKRKKDIQQKDGTFIEKIKDKNTFYFGEKN